ncbi:MAG: sulfatase [Anaerolineaceae bacterium]|nr:sulfatase [Anaerolineaceae bacterium]
MSERPNVIWIFGDQHRGQSLGYMGDPNVSTPHLNRLADEGITFTRAVAGFPLCSPFRGALISGQYPHRVTPGHQTQLDPSLPTVATAFNEAGYHTAWYGKWHVDGAQERERRTAMHIIPPERRGHFRKWIGYENNAPQFDCWVHGGEGEEAFHYRLPGYETDALTDLFIEHLKERAGEDEPFFAGLSVIPPHDPYHAPPEWMGRHIPARVALRPNVPDIPRIVERARNDLAGYHAMIENLDWNVGRIRAALEELGLYENTHVLFFSDHGDMHGSHGQFRKTSPWEESLRIPFIIGGGPHRYHHDAGFHEAPVNHVDIAPTSLGLCGLEAPGWMQGTDYSGYRLRDREIGDIPDSAYLQTVVPTMHGHSVDRPWRGIVTRDNWKYVALEGQPWLLFNLNEDPYEQANHAHNSLYHAERRHLQARLAEWIDHTGDSFRLPAP